MDAKWIAAGSGLVLGTALGWFAANAVQSEVVASGASPSERAPSREAHLEPLTRFESATGESAARTPASADARDAELANLRARNAALEARTRELEEERGRRAAELEALEAPLAWLRELSPKAFGDLTAEELLNMRRLDLSSLEVHDEDLAYLADLPALKSLTLRKTPITDAGLVHLSGADNLEHLGLRETAVTDEGMVHVRSIENLQELDVNMCAVGDAGVRELRDLDLTFLRLNYTKVTDAGLVHIPTLHSLERLDLWGTGVTEAGLDHLAAHPSLNHLELGGVSVSEHWVKNFQAAHPQLYLRSAYGR